MLASQALDLACQFGYQLREGQALTALAEIHLSRDEHDRARRYAARALDNHRQTGHRLGEARTYLVLGRLHQHAGDHPAARDHWRQAHALFTDIGTAEAVQAAALVRQ
jgi:tetratricopeptide (TPR) repeat protein